MNEPIKTVLIVDDETFIRQSFVDYFEDHLWETIEATSGEHALETKLLHIIQTMKADNE